MISKIDLAFMANNSYCNDLQLDLFKKNMFCTSKDQLNFSTTKLCSETLGKPWIIGKQNKN